MTPGVYISWPFCSQKCTYCNFASGVFPKSLEAQYAAALFQEIGLHRWTTPPDTIYIGGGTPSLMPLETLRSLLSAIPGKPWTEATMETAPGSITPAKAHAWRDAGMNRVSLGVQSFIAAEASRTGRRHTAETVKSDVAMLRDAGIGNFNIDLIAGLPGQTEASWEGSLDAVEQLEAPHVSVYMLEVDEDSRLGQEVLLNGRRYGARDVPDDETIVHLYERAVERLERIGVHRYEISNFARSGFESAHNLRYWRLTPYFGFGADAHSFESETRWQNAETPAEYIRLMNISGTARTCQSAANPAEERFFVGLRLTRGIDMEGPASPSQLQAIDRFVDEGLLERHAGTLRLTDRGVLLSNEVFAELVG